MCKEKPFVHLFETQGGKYIFDVNTNAIIKTQDDTFSLLKDLLNNHSCDNDLLYESYEKDKTIRRLKENGFLLSKKVKELVNPVSNILEIYLSNKLEAIVLQVTQQCNLRCEYCAYSGQYLNRGHKNVRMSLETAKKGIEFLIENSRDVEQVNIGFYGGEPLLEFELMKKAILYAKEISEGKKVTFSFTTNGTLFTKEIIEFLMSYDVQIAISLDGPKEVHDRNRKFAVSGCGSFDKLTKNLEFFKENYPEYFKKIGFNAVLDRTGSFNCINEFFTTYEVIKDSILMSSGVSPQYTKSEISSSNEEYDIQLNYEVFKMLLARLKKIDIENISRLVEDHYDILRKTLVDERDRQSMLADMEHHGGPCIPGAKRLFMDVDGNLYPCERVSEDSEVMRIGHVEKGFDYEKIRNILNVGKITQDSCVNCWAFRFCTLCAVFADDMNEFSAKKKLSNCRVVKGSLEDQLKDYCMLNEFGYTFNDSKVFQIVEG